MAADFEEKLLIFPKSKDSESCSIIRLGYISKVNAGWAGSVKYKIQI